MRDAQANLDWALFWLASSGPRVQFVGFVLGEAAEECGAIFAGAGLELGYAG